MKFIRKNLDPFGSYGIAIGKKTITIHGRDIYETDDKNVIELMRKDSELELIGSKKNQEKKKDSR